MTGLTPSLFLSIVAYITTIAVLWGSQRTQVAFLVREIAKMEKLIHVVDEKVSNVAISFARHQGKEE